MNTTPMVVLPHRYARRIFNASFLTIGSIASSLYNELSDCTITSGLVFLTSVNYWRYPIFGLRRNLDMMTCACSLSYQLWLAAQASETPRNCYLATVASCAGCVRYPLLLYHLLLCHRSRHCRRLLSVLPPPTPLPPLHTPSSTE